MAYQGEQPCMDHSRLKVEGAARGERVWGKEMGPWLQRFAMHPVGEFTSAAGVPTLRSVAQVGLGVDVSMFDSCSENEMGEGDNWCARSPCPAWGFNNVLREHMHKKKREYLTLEHVFLH